MKADKIAVGENIYFGDDKQKNPARIAMSRWNLAPRGSGQDGDSSSISLESCQSFIRNPNSAMKAGLLKGPGQFGCTDVPYPELPPDGAILKVDACGICGSDLRAIKHGLRFGLVSQILGHEVAGVLVEIGREVHDFAVGDRLDTCTYAVIGIAIVDRFGIRVERVRRQALSEALLKLHRACMKGGVAGVRHPIDIAELRIGQVVLRRRKRRCAQRGIVVAKAVWKCVHVPALH